jgi:predicted glycogen debranching enzyme
MSPTERGWRTELCLTEPGYFEAKPYAVDPQGRQVWPEGGNIGVSIHPSEYRTANTIYCAFVRLFSESKSATIARDERLEMQLKSLDKQGYSVIPPSGKLRDLIAQLPHIIDTLGCRILHLLPINPTPTTYARFGRYGSPYAALDLTGIDPALVEFDRRSTGVDQFRELAYAVHSRRAKLFIDLAINHTGWGSDLQEGHPEWFVRGHNGEFVSPGAWGVTWEDLSELDHHSPAPWEYFAQVFLTWCRRGVDGFRCDAGYMVPVPAWQYITARVREEFPDTIFLLEGLGGSWEATESLLTIGAMQWAYSELFQNFSPVQVAGYLDHSFRQTERVGLLVHYSETHDNNRLAAEGREWSLLRNRLCALSSMAGGYGFTCGVEWLATEKILVHQRSGLAWGQSENLIPELSRLNRLLADHPCFFDAAKVTRLSSTESPVLALRRESADNTRRLLILVNTDIKQPHKLILAKSAYEELGRPEIDLLGQPNLKPALSSRSEIVFQLEKGACFCLTATNDTTVDTGDEYRRARARAAWAIAALSKILPLEGIGPHQWQTLAAMIDADPSGFLAASVRLDRQMARTDLTGALQAAKARPDLPRVVTWTLADLRRQTVVPPHHWLVVQDTTPFRASLDWGPARMALHAQSVETSLGHFACFFPAQAEGDCRLQLERYASQDQQVVGQLRFLAATPDIQPRSLEKDLVLLTNSRGGMARMCVDLGSIQSKYDCLLGANLHPEVPTDRHVFAKRARVWVNANGFISPLNQDRLVHFEPGPPARWRFISNAGDGRAVQIDLVADMLDQCNTTVLRFGRSTDERSANRDEDFEVRITVRIDIEDRNFHSETKRNGGAEWHFQSHSQPLADRVGFQFQPASDRHLRVYADAGQYHHEGEWCDNVAHPVEQSRGQTGSGDAYSPGWFDLPLQKGSSVTLIVTADSTDLPLERIAHFPATREAWSDAAVRKAELAQDDFFAAQLARAVHAFVVRRGPGKTVIAGYPWFLDWGRDSLICARGMLSAGLVDEVHQLLLTFGRFEKDGTLPNSIHGEDASNRDTSDASLWYGVVCEDAAIYLGEDLLRTSVDASHRPISDVLRSIALGYIRGTPNGIRMDEATGLIWSPAHFTWMDTNYPAGTPREGYPIEIQVLWIRLLKQLNRAGIPGGEEAWGVLARRAEQAFHERYWIEGAGYLADHLIARSGVSARQAVVDNALRSNCLFAVSLGLVEGARAQDTVAAALRHLVIPGGLRTLAPLPVSPPLPIYSNVGSLLNDPVHPYWGHYEGDEDTRRKPAYHNGTAWTWTFPTFCEALARAWRFSAASTAAARAYLASMDRLLADGCVGHLPEILDGDLPHEQRGCDAQAWGATEALRVWKLLTAGPDLPREQDVDTH